MITLPHYNWFFQIQEGKPVTNVFSGSSGTEPSTGCFSIITFDYKVYVTDYTNRIYNQYFVFPFSFNISNTLNFIVSPLH